MEDPIVLGCDSVNLSLDSTSPGFTYNATYQELLDRLADSDIVMVNPTEKQVFAGDTTQLGSRVAGSPAAENPAPFVDVEAGSWYTDAVAWAVETGLIQGVTANTLEPQSTTNRAQLATILLRCRDIFAA